MNIITLLKNKSATNPFLEEEILNPNSLCSILYINAFSYNILRNRTELLDRATFLLTDGILLVFFLRLFKVTKAVRKTFDMTSIAPKVFEHCQRSKKKIFFIGASDDEVQRFVKIIQKNYPNIDIAGFRNGYFKDEESQEIINQILTTNPNYIVVGLGTPKQEFFINQFYKKHSQNKISIFSCGGFIHQTQTQINYYPKWINKLNLRMPYRLIKENLYHRLPALPKFVIFFYKDYVKSKKAS